MKTIKLFLFAENRQAELPVAKNITYKGYNAYVLDKGVNEFDYHEAVIYCPFLDVVKYCSFESAMEVVNL